MITQNLVIYPAINPVRTCGKYSHYKVRQEYFNGAVTILVRVAILVNKTGNVMDFTLFYVFLLVINTTSLCIYQEQCCFVFIFSVPCIMMEWSIQLQLNVPCYRIFSLNSCKCRALDTLPHYLIHN